MAWIKKKTAIQTVIVTLLLFGHAIASAALLLPEPDIQGTWLAEFPLYKPGFFPAIDYSHP